MVALLQTAARLLWLNSCKIAVSRNVPTSLLFCVLLINLLWCFLESYLALLRKISFLWLSFFLLNLPLKMCTVRCCSEVACCPPWGDFRLQLFWGSYSFFFFCLRLSFLNLLPFKLYCYYTNGFVSSYGEGLCQKINTTTSVEITYYNYYTQIISLDSDCR